MSSSDAFLQGGCLCGAVRYQITGVFACAGHCHCSLCRRAHGAAFATWGILHSPSQFRWTSGSTRVRSFESSPGHWRCFCGGCGTPLAAAHEGDIGEVVLATVDGDPGVRPREHIFTASKAVWHDIHDALPQHAAWPLEAQVKSAALAR